ncbi:MAG: hypothetical protein FK730_14580 [Asgard group archaeon]|nr:hypothetical protein [Asgard group archaeon]
MKEIDIVQLKEQQTSMEQFESKQKLYTSTFFIAVFISITIVMFEATRLVEINLIEIWISYLLSALPILIFCINLLFYLLPLIPTKRIKKKKIVTIDYYTIIKEQTKPTLLKYKVRKIFLVGFFIIGIFAIAVNIVVFVIEIFL